MAGADELGDYAREKEIAMTGIYIMLGTMVLFATVIGVWDLIGQRQARRDLTRR